MAVLPVYNVLAAPGSDIPISKDEYQRAVGRVPVVGEKVTMIFLKEKEMRLRLSEDSFFRIGLSGVITEIGEQGHLIVQTGERLTLCEIAIDQDQNIHLRVERRADIDDLDQAEAERHLKEVKQALIRFFANSQWDAMVRGMLSAWSSMGDIAGMMSRWMVNTPQERFAVLEEDSRGKREQMLEQMIYENLEFSRVNGEARSAQEADHQKLYRETAIKKQMEYLQRELEELHPEAISDLRKLELKVQNSGMNEEAKEEAEKVLNRLKQEGTRSAETGMLYEYLDYVTGLSWKKEKPSIISLTEAEAVLDEDHFGMKKVKERILQQIAVMRLTGRQSGSILLFVGAPGTGKTSVGQSIARALKRACVRVSLGGVRDEADIRGHRRTYIGAMAGRIIDGIRKSGVSNPVMVLDEVDKLASSYQGDPASALLEVLDPEQNAKFTDHYLNVPYDLSDVLFICTANTRNTIPEPLLNRMEVIPFQGYTGLEKFQIATRHLLPKAMKEIGITEQQFRLEDAALRTLIEAYTRESGVRELKRCIDHLCRAAAVEIVKRETEEVHQTEAEKVHQTEEEKAYQAEAEKAHQAETEKAMITVTEENLADYMDKHPLHGRKIESYASPGIVTGLAWTAFGGEILSIETMLVKGSGKIVITGRLGDVMKESAQIAVSKVKKLLPEQAKCFENHDLHIHVPDGATPKDGPSAGITLTVALASLVSGVAVPPDTAMTGEVSLQSKLHPIGGLSEKLMAAQRAGVTRVFIPPDNEEDLQEVAEEVTNQLEIIPIKSVEEVLRKLGIPVAAPETATA